MPLASCLLLLHLFQQIGQSFQVEGAYAEIQQVAVAVEKFVGGPAMDIKMALDSGLLLWGQIIVSYVRATDIVLLDDVLPCRLLSNPHYPGATLLFQRDVADDEGTLSVTFFEVEGVGNGIERLEGEREV